MNDLEYLFLLNNFLMNQATDSPHYVGLLELETIAKVRQYLLLQLRCSEQLVK